MADVIVAKSTGQSFAPHPAGPFALVCVDVIDLGERVEQYQHNPARVVHKCALVFESGETNEDGRAYQISAEFTVSMFETAGLRKFLSSWRGKPYTEEEAKTGAPLHKLEGVACFANVIHKTSLGGRTYAKLDSVMPLPKGMTKPTLAGKYERGDYWAERKAEYTAEVAKHRGQQEPTGYDEVPEALDDDDDSSLPF